MTYPETEIDKAGLELHELALGDAGRDLLRQRAGRGIERDADTALAIRGQYRLPRRDAGAARGRRRRGDAALRLGLEGETAHIDRATAERRSTEKQDRQSHAFFSQRPASSCCQ